MRALILAASLLCTSNALAFHGQADFARRGIEGGGGGMYYTGAERWRGYDCTVCHVDADETIRFSVNTTPAELIVDGRYTPGQTYAFEVRLQGEHRGLTEEFNPNTFVLEIVDSSGAPVGRYGSFDENAERPPGQNLVVAKGESWAVDQWSFEWTAPDAGTGLVTLHLAGVDGDGASGRLGRTGDPFGDDVFVGALSAGENESAPVPTMGGCSASGRSSLGGAFLMLLLLVRRRSWMCLPLLAALGCDDPETGIRDCERGICSATDAGRDATEVDAPGLDAPGFDAPGFDATDFDGCIPNWECTAWEAPCGSDMAMRECTDANACGSDLGRPALTQMLPALDENFFRCRVQPVFDLACSQLACHGSDERPLRIYGRSRYRIDENARGKHGDGGADPLTDEEWCRNFDSARGFFTEDTDESELLSQPLDPLRGGLEHVGVRIYASTSEADYQVLRDWLTGASLGSCNTGFN